MSEKTPAHKIIFRFHSELFGKEVTEELWAQEVDAAQGLYQIDSMPSFTPLIATEDVVRAEFSKMEEGLLYKETVTPSGNSNIQVIRQNEETPLLDLRQRFADLGCVSEQVNEDFFVMEVSVNVNYAVVKELLDELEEQEEIEYAEPCLSDVHREQTGG
ncbi:DUF4265 domain-containing protein [Pontibacter akesuensis]|uniref:DUF4265 domain-containing protein n=1 Tax=Pontibacter akesuensis TaxID=388950 RepID=A0A1I7I1R7_9BACT|nr:DUF4265 domain-containing protein [Pontibacter akesuensis]GHA64737.1 hypothetical protein GCM10007389_16820 [Pontibacter akesuensis]SFU66845.1 protein of unknown function [Pontibacter akesuensis]